MTTIWDDDLPAILPLLAPGEDESDQIYATIGAVTLLELTAVIDHVSRRLAALQQQLGKLVRLRDAAKERGCLENQPVSSAVRPKSQS